MIFILSSTLLDLPSVCDYTVCVWQCTMYTLHLADYNNMMFQGIGHFDLLDEKVLA